MVENLKQTDEFLISFKLPKLDQEETINQNSPKKIITERNLLDTDTDNFKTFMIPKQAK